MKSFSILIVAACATGAFAQMDPCVAEAKAKPLAARVGLGTFTNKGTNNFTRDSHFAVGLTYRPGIPCMIAPGRGTPGVDLDFIDVAGNGNRINAIGLTYGTRIMLGQSGGFYGGFGVGAFSTRLRTAANNNNNNNEGRPTRATGDGLPAGTSKTMTRMGAKLMLGMNGKSGEFFELSYFLVSKVRGGDVNRANLSVGFKF